MTPKEQTVAVNRAGQAVQRLAKSNNTTSLLCALTLAVLPRVSDLAETRKLLQSRFDDIFTVEYIQQSELLDLFIVLHVLHCEGKSFSGEEMACVANRLLAAEQEVGGPYRSEDGRIDVLANAYIGAFIREIAKPLPKLEAYIDTQLPQYGFMHPLYTPQACAYLLDRIYPNEMVSDFLGADQSASSQTTALNLLIGSNKDRDEAVKALLKMQLSDGSWQAEEFVKGKRSKLLTTALIMQGLTKDLPVEKHTSTIPSLEEELHGDIICKGFQVYTQTAEPLKASGYCSIARVIGADKQHEITLLPFYFAKALDLAMDIKAVEKYRQLGLANMLCWTAYTIYDHLLDDEGDPYFLSAANVAQRASLTAYSQAVGQGEEFLLYVSNGFLGMDETNAWELKNCRYRQKNKRIFLTNLPDFAELDMLANRSFGHVLGPLALVYTMRATATMHQKKAFESALRHYLIARQLTDDIHDWQADIKKGHVSYVVASILQELAVPPGNYDKDRLLRIMRLCFWSRTLPEVAERILGHTRQARTLLKDSNLVVHGNYIWPFIDKLETSARVALDTQIDSHAFLHTYQHSTTPMVRSNV